jgi:hypothetical protein
VTSLTETKSSAPVGLSEWEHRKEMATKTADNDLGLAMRSAWVASNSSACSGK